MYEQIYLRLSDLSSQLNIKKPKDEFIDFLAEQLSAYIKNREYMESVFDRMLKTYNKQSFPKFADFYSIIENFPDIKRLNMRKIPARHYEFAEKLGLPVEVINKMTYYDYTPRQREILCLVEPKIIISNILKQLKKRSII